MSDPETVDAEDPMTALAEAVQVAAGVAALAKLVGASVSAPSMWRQRKRVPAEHCPAIERETGVRCERLRPDVDWSVLRAKPTAVGSQLA